MRDTITTVKQLKMKVKKFQQERNWNPHAKNLAVSIVIEAAELLEHYQWDDYSEYQKREDARQQKIEKELSDIIIYCLEFAEANRIDIAAAVGEKIEHNEKKYPAHLFRKEGKDAGKNTTKSKRNTVVGNSAAVKKFR